MANGEEILKFLEEELEEFEKLYRELMERNKIILTKSEILISKKKEVSIPVIIIRKEKPKPKPLPKPKITKERPKTLPKPKIPSQTKIIPITYEDSELGSEV